MSDYPLFIPEFMLYTKSSLLWFKITTKLREFRNYLIMDRQSSGEFFSLPQPVFPAVNFLSGGFRHLFPDLFELI